MSLSLVRPLNCLFPFFWYAPKCRLSPLLFALFINSAPPVLYHAKLLIFTDDIKLYLRINYISDCSLIQQDLSNFMLCSEYLGISMNIPKCAVFSFYRSYSRILFFPTPYIISLLNPRMTQIVTLDFAHFVTYP